MVSLAVSLAPILAVGQAPVPSDQRDGGLLHPSLSPSVVKRLVKPNPIARAVVSPLSPRSAEGLG